MFTITLPFPGYGQKLDDALVHLIKIISIKDASDFTLTDWDAVIDRAIVNARTRRKKAVYVQRTITVNQNFVSDQVLPGMIMEELLVNSMQYNLHEQVQVSISITDRDAGVLLTLSDNGVGIREEEKGNIFEMFYKRRLLKWVGALYCQKYCGETARPHPRSRAARTGALPSIYAFLFVRVLKNKFRFFARLGICNRALHAMYTGGGLHQNQTSAD